MNKIFTYIQYNKQLVPVEVVKNSGMYTVTENTLLWLAQNFESQDFCNIISTVHRIPIIN